MFAFQWKEFSPPLSSAHRLSYRQKRDTKSCNSRGTQNTYFSLATNPPPPPHQLGPLANERAVPRDVTLWRCTLWSGRIASPYPLFSIMTLCARGVRIETPSRRSMHSLSQSFYLHQKIRHNNLVSIQNSILLTIKANGIAGIIFMPVNSVGDVVKIPTGWYQGLVSGSRHLSISK